MVKKNICLLVLYFFAYLAQYLFSISVNFSEDPMRYHANILYDSLKGKRKDEAALIRLVSAYTQVFTLQVLLWSLQHKCQSHRNTCKRPYFHRPILLYWALSTM